MGAESLFLDIYGLTVQVSTTWRAVLDAVRLDYAWFVVEHRTDAAVVIEVEQAEPDFDGFAGMPPGFVTPRGAVFANESGTVIDHHGRAVSFLYADGNRLHVTGSEAAASHDAVYYFILGRAGEYLDSRGLRRLHGLGVGAGSGASVVLAPSSGGKTTLAIQAIDAEGVVMFSEDSPLVDRRGFVHPFPLRIGVSTDSSAASPSARRIERLGSVPKVAVEVASFANKIAPTPLQLRNLVITRRSLWHDPELIRLPRRAAVAPLVREGVIGLGLYQGVGFAHQRGASAVAHQARTGLARLSLWMRLLQGIDVWQLTLSRDATKNWSALQRLLASG